MKLTNKAVKIIFLLLIVTFTEGCSDANNLVDINDNEFLNAHAKVTLNGAGYKNEEIVFNTGYSSFSKVDNQTYIGIWGSYENDTVYIALQIEGSGTGIFNWNKQSGDLVVNKMNSNDAFLFIADSRGNNTISSFGKVGERIEGKISGRLYEISSLEEINVQGNFSVVRGPDSN